MAALNTMTNKKRLFALPEPQGGLKHLKKLLAFGMILLLTIGVDVLAQDSPQVISYVGRDAVYLRWEGLRSANVNGFRVYRRSSIGAGWTQVGADIQRLREPEQINDLLGELRGNVVLSLYGAVNPVRTIDQTVFENLFNNRDAVALLKVVSLVNWDFGFVHGEICIDSISARQVQAQYRVTALQNGAESELGQTKMFTTTSAQVIAPVAYVNIEPQNGGIRLSWPRPLEDMRRGDIVTFNIYRADDVLGPFERVNGSGYLPVVNVGAESAAAAEESFQDRFLDFDREYFYYVKSVNAFGFESAPSPIVSARPDGSEVPGPPRNIVWREFGSGVMFNWRSPRGGKASGYEVWRREDNETEFKRMHPLSDALWDTATSWIDPMVRQGVNYRYFLRSTAGEGKFSAPSDTVDIVLADTRAPRTPGGFTAVADTGLIRLSWNAVDAADLLGYVLERASDRAMGTRFKLHEGYLTDTSYVDTLPRESQTFYGYVVHAVDRSYNNSAPTDLIALRLPDVTPPPAPFIRRFEQIGGSRELLVEWTSVAAEDLALYRLKTVNNGREELVEFPASTVPEYRWTVVDSGRVAVAVAAVDSAGNASDYSTMQTLSMPLNTLPAQPEMGSATNVDGKLTLSWRAGAGPPPAGYVIMRVNKTSGKKINAAQLDAPASSFVDRSAQIDQAYRYEIEARDERWRSSPALVIEYEPGK